MTDERLLAFVDWCRMNDYHVTHDLTIVRRVFRSYDTYETDLAAPTLSTRATPVTPPPTADEAFEPERLEHLY